MHMLQRKVLALPPLTTRAFSRSISFTCRGEPIQHAQLFEYTNGRFLVNERSEKAKRYAEFNVDALCTLASYFPSVSLPISKIDKMEGGFHKIVAKILFPLRAHSAVPVPNVIAWNSDASNPIGSEYILMEKARSRQLVDVWGDMDQLQRFKLIKKLARLEGQLASLEFPVMEICEWITINDEYVLGPAYNESWFPQCENGNHSGPCSSSGRISRTSVFALAGRGLTHIQTSTFLPRGPQFGSKDKHSEILEAAMEIIPKLAEHPIVKPHSRPTLWHRDLHLGNAYNYETGLIKPELPPNYDEMDADEKAFAVTERDQALLLEFFEAALTKNHLPSSFALTRVHSAIRHLFSSCEPTWKDGIIPLRDSLIQISESWHELGLPGSCPFSITDDDLSKHRLELSRYMDWHKLKSYTQELLHSDDDGWVSPQLDFGKVQERHAELYPLYLQGQAEEISEEEGKRLWFYIDRD
ncbi:hypothetical protein BDV39DRAFT_196688 [Aspergillus sergii]|uniref:Altered inheritance of mitochondria protein 9, mitochondrial n=1 Tax=Aspergillus sergii TaxID=1034303 RepID=A0A5N6WNY9_9EURO|nr:hypothetical protein BDV39DRAFT_196688 [Aspergillus sergii]